MQKFETSFSRKQASKSTKRRSSKGPQVGKLQHRPLFAAPFLSYMSTTLYHSTFTCTPVPGSPPSKRGAQGQADCVQLVNSDSSRPHFPDLTIKTIAAAGHILQALSHSTIRLTSCKQLWMWIHILKFRVPLKVSLSPVVIHCLGQASNVPTDID